MGQMPTLMDVAQLAGVSYATADRVVNARAGVADKSRKKVEAAISQLGYVRNIAAANLSQGRIYKFGFLLPAGGNPFFDHMRRIIAARSTLPTPHRTEVTIYDVPAFDADALCARLDALRHEGLDGLAVVGIDHPEVAKSLNNLRAAGTAVVTLVSHVETASATPYVGVDNTAAGRTAGRLIGLAHAGQPGKVQVILGSLSLRDHADRYAGARDVFARDFPHLTVLPPLAGLDQEALVQTLLTQQMERHPEITAVYAVGAGSEGVTAALAALSPSARRPLCILHELTPNTRTAVEAGLVDAVIDQQPDQEVSLAFAILQSAADRLPLPKGRRIAPTIYLKDNLPPISLDERPDHD